MEATDAAGGRFGLLVRTDAGPGVLHALTGAIAGRGGDIAAVEILERQAGEARVYFEVELDGDPAALADDLRALPRVREVGAVATLRAIYGKRIIIMGGGAQVGQVAIGAISEADRHNIRASASRSTPSRSSASGRWRPRCGPWRGCRGRRRSCSPAR
jgi:energy-converting hydrogenase B subunit Q